MDKNIGSLSVDLIANITKFKSELDKATTIADTSTKDIGTKLSSVGSSMVKTGGVLTGALSVPLIAFGSVAVDAASDLSESMSKANVVFGDSAQAIDQFAANSAQSLGISKQAAYEATGTFGNLFTSIGLTQDASADLSMDVVSLSSDLASFNNLDPTEVLEKLRSGLTGETEPLKALGININQAMIEAKAMEMGLADLDGNLSTAAITQARYALILEQSKNAQGDFARTSDGLANKTRINKAAFENVKTALGDKLLPVITQASSLFLPLLDRFSKLSPATMGWIVGIGAVIAILPILITTIGGVISGVGAIITFFSTASVAAFLPVLGIIAAVIAVAALLYLAWKNNFLGIQGITSTVITAVSGFWTGTLLPAFKAVGNFIQTYIFPVFKALGEFIGAVFTLAFRVLAGVFQNVLVPAFKAIFSWLGEKLQPVFEAIGKFVNDKLKPAFDGLGNGIQKVVDFIKSLTSAIKNIKLPKWLTPGSPFPLTIAMIGLGESIQDVNKNALSEFSTKLNVKGNLNSLVPSVSSTQSKTDFDYDRLDKIYQKNNEQLVKRFVQELSLKFG